MDIIIVGAGKVGAKLVEDLYDEQYNVVLIDINSEVCRQIQEDYDVMCINGSGTDLQILDEAGVKKADLFIAVTDNDEFNALCAVMASKLGAKRCVARVRNIEYFKQLDFMRNVLGINLTVNPEYETASEISRMLRFPAAIKVETFARGRLELIETKVDHDSVLCNRAVSEVYRSIKVKVLICAVQRGQEVFIPNGDFVIRSGDKLSITASHSDLTKFMRAVGVIQKRLKTVMIIGGGRISYYLARQLIESGMRVKIIEHKRDRCEYLTQYLPKADIVCGDGTDRHVLEEEGIQTVDSIVTLTGIDEENMIISMYAKSRNVDKVITKVNRLSFADIMESTGVYSIVSPKNITANMILGYVRAMKSAHDAEIRTLYRIVNNKAEALEFVVNNASALTSKPLAELKLKENVLIAAILRKNKMIKPDGNSTLEVGDRVMVVTTQYLTSLSDILD